MLSEVYLCRSFLVFLSFLGQISELSENLLGDKEPHRVVHCKQYFGSLLQAVSGVVTCRQYSWCMNLRRSQGKRLFGCCS